MLSNSPTALIDFALPKWEADPNVRIEDAYKWLYQATRGGEHMALSREAVAETLEREWLSLGTACEGELLWVPLDPDEKVGRLNIRPFKDREGNIGDLVDAFVPSSMAYGSGPEGFINVWIELGERLKTCPSNQFNHSEWSGLNTVVKAKEFPAIHHSDGYRAARKPAYRVLTTTEVRRLIDAAIS
ncbi:hypothetical protein BH20ACI2_BH20ACI2_08560 [soil metagenome]